MADPAPTGVASTIATIATTVATIEPIIAPEVLLIVGIIKAYQLAHNGQFPPVDQVNAGYKAVTDAINAAWANWVPQGK